MAETKFRNPRNKYDLGEFQDPGLSQPWRDEAHKQPIADPYNEGGGMDPWVSTMKQLNLP
jgi:hypothetical protein